MMPLASLYRILATRRAVERIMWQARAEVIRAQLVTMRQTMP